MWIKKLYATFGCLENKTLELSPGLNIITAPNESGKSTWSAFIRAMLYGISTREKARIGHIPDKERYRPRSGSAMYGRMEICNKGTDIEIERKSRFDIFSSVDARNVFSDEPVETGEALIGVSRSVYERTAFIGQSKISIDGNRDTERLILSIASGEDENTSAAEVISRLEKRQRALRSPRGLGAISELEREIERLESGALSESIAALRDEWRTLSLSASRAETALSEARRSCAEAEREMSLFPSFDGMSDSRAKTAAAHDIERLQDAKKKKIPLFTMIPLMLSAVCAMLVVTVNKVFAIPAILLAGITLIISCLFAFKHHRMRRRISTELQEKYGSAQTEDIENALKAYISAFGQLEEAEAKVQRLKRETQRAKISADMKEAEFQKAEAQAKEEASAKLSGLLAQKEQLLLEFEACELAAKTISAADAELKSRFSPELERQAAEIFCRLTGGGFDRVKIKNSDFDMEVAKGEASAPIPALTLSQGTADELYLSLRLALCKTVLGQKDAPPIVLDDALVNFDDVRMMRALDLLKEISASQQVILFTCHDREAKYFENDASVNKITL